MSVSKKFRNAIAGVTALTSVAGLQGCGTVPVGETGLPVGASSYGFITPNYTKEHLASKVTRLVNGQPTETVIEERQVILRERTVVQQATDVLTGFSAAARDVMEGQASRDIGRGVKDGQLKPGDYYNSETTTVAQQADPTVSQAANPAFTVTTTQQQMQEQTANGGAGGTGGAGGAGGATGPVTATGTGGAATTGPVTATGTGGAATTGPVTATGTGGNAGAGAAATVITPPPAPTPGGPR